jgi:hypothetical protein
MLCMSRVNRSGAGKTACDGLSGVTSNGDSGVDYPAYQGLGRYPGIARNPKMKICNLWS